LFENGRTYARFALALALRRIDHVGAGMALSSRETNNSFDDDFISEVIF
jgi:hypothetical protein